MIDFQRIAPVRPDGNQTLVCIGGPCDGQRMHVRSIIRIVRLMAPPKETAISRAPPAPADSTEKIERAYYVREEMHFKDDPPIAILRYEHMSLREAVTALVARYPKEQRP